MRVLEWMNSADDGELSVVLWQICPSDVWVRGMCERRPYPDEAAMCQANVEGVTELSDDEVVRLANAHPRVGRPEDGDARSASEQAHLNVTTQDMRERLAAANAAYERQFGHVFLICTAGLRLADILEELAKRIGHSPEQERAAVRRELVKINDGRLRLLGGRARGVPG